ncbi:MAG: hypothetical protein IPL35_05415 [Sphingobacteriales bacterium]|nr:hypothetical protein [Sphingobacteriales bacterium]
MKNLLHFYLLLCVWIHTAPAAQAQWNTTWQYVHPKPSISEIAAVGASASGAVAMAGGRGFAVWANNQWQGGSQEIYGTVNDMLLLNEQTALASTSRGIYRSTDGGITWQYINYGPYGGIWGFHCNELQTLPDGTVLASCSDYLRSYVYRSIDSGETWEYKFFEIDEEVGENIAFIDTIYGFVAGQMNHLLKTTDTGNTWQTLLVPTAGDAFIRDVHFFNTQKGLCVAENGNIAITYDGGNTWQSAADFAGMRFYKMVFKNELSGFAFAKDSNDNIHLFKTNNGGSYWFEVDNALQLSDISFADYGNAVVYGSNSTDVYRSFDDAASWNSISQRNAYGTVREMQFLNPSLGYAIIGDGIYGSSDGGATWQQQYQGEAADSLRLLQFLNPLLGYAYADNSKILRTFDGGLTWINTDEYIESETGNYTEVNNLHFFSRKKGKLYLTSLNAQGIPIGELFETEDGGFVWKKIFGGTQFIRFKKLFWRSEQEVFATQQDGAKLFHSTDGGKTWNAVWQSNDFLNILDLSFVGDDYIYGSGKACIAKSENGGSTWQAAPSYLNFANIEFFDKDKGYILNHLGNVEYNNGLILTEEWQGWSVIKSLPQANHILLVNPNRLLVYGDNAVIIRAEIENKAYTDFDYTYIPECEGTTLQFSYFENYPYTQNFYWTIDGDTVGYEKNLNYFFPEEKTYRVALHTYSDAYGTLSRSKDIYISPRSPEIIPSGDLMACSQSGAAITLSAQPVWYNSVEWSQGSSSPTITVSDAAAPYSAIFYSNYCGTQTDSIVAPFRTTPEVALNAADTVCVQGALQLQASGAGTFQWQFPTTQILNDSTAVVVTPASGNYPASYTVQITDAYGCTATATATVYEGNAAAQVALSASASTVCPNDTIIIEAQGGAQVQWLFPHQIINNNTVAYYTGNAPSFPDTLEAFVTDNQACAALATLTLQADDLKK